MLWTHLFEPHSGYMPHPEFPTTLSGIQGLEEKYDYEIAFVDLWIGKILKALDETKLASNTAVVVFGDHGEAWGEHKVYFHGQNLTEEQIRVPLIVAIPGRKPIVSDEEAGSSTWDPPWSTWSACPRPPPARPQPLAHHEDGLSAAAAGLSPSSCRPPPPLIIKWPSSTGEKSWCTRSPSIASSSSTSTPTRSN